MPRSPGKVPAYSCHKASGRAVVRIDHRDYYLGLFGSPESHQKYQQLIAQWQAERACRAQDQQLAVQAAGFSMPLVEVLRRYRQFAAGYYCKNGKPTKEFLGMKYALRPLRILYGNLLAREFGPLKLKAVRQQMIDANLSRGVINNRINRIKRFFKWAVSEELVPPSVYEGLRTVAGLRFGRSNARETEPVKPVPDAWVEAVLPHVAPQVATMIQLQRLTGMRPCEVVIMRSCDIDMSGDVWVYEPYDHKNRWRGHRRLVPLGPRAQQLIKPFLSLKTDAFLFSPQEAEAKRNSLRRQARQTPMTPSQAKRRPKKKPLRPKRDRYDVNSYRRAITYGIQRGNRGRPEDDQVPNWYPLQLRHSRATEVRRGFGLEAAQVSLGHAHANVTEVYAERNLELAVKIARASG